MDGQIDFSTYSYADLIDAASHIDESKHPIRARALRAELAKRRPIEEQRRREAERLSLHDLLKGAPILGWLQFGAAAALAVTLVQAIVTDKFTSPVIVLGLTVIALNTVAGTLTLRAKPIGFLLSALNYALQTPSFVLGSLHFAYTGLGGLWIKGLYTSEKWALRFDVGFQPAFRFRHGGTIYEQFVAVDVMALAFAGMLFAAFWASRRGENG